MADLIIVKSDSNWRHYYRAATASQFQRPDYAAATAGDAGLETLADERLLGFYDGIRRVAELALRKRMEEGSSALFDCYRSVADPNLMIFVAKDVVPPFRFKAGGWEFLQSSTELESAIINCIAQNGYSLLRTNENQAGRIELTDLSTPSPEVIEVPKADQAASCSRPLY
jgi:hypothetical protein